jgi:predicted nucleotidyltransferase component of viral defense system
MKEDIKNKPASVKAKLLNLAKSQGIDFDALLLRYMQERFLYRLSVSKHSGHFVLKGGLLLICHNVPHSRPTIDIDFLAQRIKNSHAGLKTIIQDIAHIEYTDGINFDSGSVRSEDIREGAEYHGIRLKIEATLGKARKILQIDVGFGDDVVPQPQEMDFPTILDDQHPRLKVYSLESMIAEKFEAMIKLSLVNSRMKDFYDIYSLALSDDFNGKVLFKAVQAAFARRETPLPENPVVFTKEFYEDKNRQKQWQAYLRKIREKEISDHFSIVMQKINEFLGPIILAINDKAKIPGEWKAPGPWV